MKNDTEELTEAPLNKTGGYVRRFPSWYYAAAVFWLVGSWLAAANGLITLPIWVAVLPIAVPFIPGMVALALILVVICAVMCFAVAVMCVAVFVGWVADFFGFLKRRYRESIAERVSRIVARFKRNRSSTAGKVDD